MVSHLATSHCGVSLKCDARLRSTSRSAWAVASAGGHPYSIRTFGRYRLDGMRIRSVHHSLGRERNFVAGVAVSWVAWFGHCSPCQPAQMKLLRGICLRVSPNG
jgi:hypothetical protein